VNKLLNISYLFIFLFIFHCSLDTKTGFWTPKKKIEKEKELNTKKLFKKDTVLNKELNPSYKINLTSNLIKNSFKNNHDNNNGRIDYNGSLKNISKFKFSKIDNFNQYEPEIIFEKNNVIFFDNKGYILKFDNSSKLLWKKNYYLKREKKSKPILFFANKGKILIVTDSLGKYYAINIDNGNLIWQKQSPNPFNSEIKIYKDRFFAIDFDNTLRCFSIKSGKEIWNIQTDKSFIKSQKKLSLIIVNEKIYFNNSTGDISAADIENGNLLWQTPTQGSQVYGDAFYLKTSDIIANNNAIFLSNNKNQFFSLDINSGNIIWEQKINSYIRSTLIDDFIFSVSTEGFMFVTNINSGKIIRITDIFRVFKEKKRKTIKPVGFIIGTENTYLSTNHGRLIIIDTKSGKVKSVLKIDRDKISRPFVLNQNLFIIKDNSIIKLN
jgi:outer membrane protein assembly factor BamB